MLFLQRVLLTGKGRFHLGKHEPPRNLAELLTRKRGRPKSSKQRVLPQSLEEKFKSIAETKVGVPAIYASTTKGGMKLIYEGHHFRYSYRKGQYSVFQCCYKENKEECKVRVLSDQKRIYPLEGEHVHFVQATDKSVTDVTFEPAALQDESNDTFVELGSAEKEQQQQFSIKLMENNSQNADNYEIYESEYLQSIQDETVALQSEGSVRNAAIGEGDTASDPNDFREKIKQRLQKALMAKKK